MAKNEKKQGREDGRTFDEGTHPGAYITKHDADKNLLDYMELVDLVDLVDPISKKRIDKNDGSVEPANQASPPATDPPVPNRAHTEI